ncbi:beta-lactamase/transpeptidase-like protein [Cladochytrium replicatum]|nr:beta-lactamase/transpeptidase-like protein [Cladochytrium replicatum]
MSAAYWHIVEEVTDFVETVVVPSDVEKSRSHTTTSSLLSHHSEVVRPSFTSTYSDASTVTLSPPVQPTTKQKKKRHSKRDSLIDDKNNDQLQQQPQRRSSILKDFFTGFGRRKSVKKASNQKQGNNRRPSIADPPALVPGNLPVPTLENIPEYDTKSLNSVFRDSSGRITPDNRSRFNDSRSGTPRPPSALRRTASDPFGGESQSRSKEGNREKDREEDEEDDEVDEELLTARRNLPGQRRATLDGASLERVLFLGGDRDGHARPRLTSTTFEKVASRFVDGYFRDKIESLADSGRSSTHGGVVGIVNTKSGSTILKAFGKADPRTGVKVDPERTLWAIGSLTKTFTAAAFLSAWEDTGGDESELTSVDINALLSKYESTEHGSRMSCGFRLPSDGMDRPNRPVTPVSLMTHTAGLEDTYFGSCTDSTDPVVKLELPPALHTRWQLLHGFPRRYIPAGLVSSYSSPAYALVGYMGELISGVSYPQLVREKILEPLGMRNTTVTLHDPRDEVGRRVVRRGEEARSEGLHVAMPEFDEDEEEENERRKAEFVPSDSLRVLSLPSGSMYSTASDMSKFMHMILNKGFLNARTPTNPKGTKPAPSKPIGLGLESRAVTQAPATTLPNPSGAALAAEPDTPEPIERTPETPTRVLQDRTLRYMTTRQFAAHPVSVHGVTCGLFEKNLPVSNPGPSSRSSRVVDDETGSTEETGYIRVLEHFGDGTVGFSSLMFLIPASGIGVFVAFNNANAREEIMEFYASFLDLVYGPTRVAEVPRAVRVRRRSLYVENAVDVLALGGGATPNALPSLAEEEHAETSSAKASSSPASSVRSLRLTYSSAPSTPVLGRKAFIANGDVPSPNMSVHESTLGSATSTPTPTMNSPRPQIATPAALTDRLSKLNGTVNRRPRAMTSSTDFISVESLDPARPGPIDLRIFEGLYMTTRRQPSTWWNLTAVPMHCRVRVSPDLRTLILTNPLPDQLRLGLEKEWVLKPGMFSERARLSKLARKAGNVKFGGEGWDDGDTEVGNESVSVDKDGVVRIVFTLMDVRFGVDEEEGEGGAGGEKKVKSRATVAAEKLLDPYPTCTFILDPSSQRIFVNLPRILRDHAFEKVHPSAPPRQNFTSFLPPTTSTRILAGLPPQPAQTIQTALLKSLDLGISRGLGFTISVALASNTVLATHLLTAILRTIDALAARLAYKLLAPHRRTPSAPSIPATLVSATLLGLQAAFVVTVRNLRAPYRYRALFRSGHPAPRHIRYLFGWAKPVVVLGILGCLRRRGREDGVVGAAGAVLLVWMWSWKLASWDLWDSRARGALLDGAKKIVLQREE